MKPISEFGKDKSRSRGYQYRCKPCHKIAVRKGVIRGDKKTGPAPLSMEYRFWLKVIKRPGCWGWSGSKNFAGYGKLSKTRGSWVTSSRFSWELHFGSPGDLLVLHRCDNPECTNPKHLFLGTQIDNMHDMYAKNRGRWRHKNK